jgi:hypothetical protein
MPTVRKLSQDEIQGLRSRGSRVDLAPYEEGLQGLNPGDWGAISLEPTDKVPTVKRRYTMAARNQNKTLVYKRLRNSTLPFEVRPLT